MTGQLLLLLTYILIFAAALAFVALGGMFSERSGIINIGLEGIMVMSGFIGLITLVSLSKTILADSTFGKILIVVLTILAAILTGILYSGLLTSYSILFALSFQPLMQNALFPIALFGVISFCNHGMRALSGVISGKFMRNFNIRKMVVPLFILYILVFICIFKILSLTKIVTVILLLIFICAVIGIQLVFTILHISRLHKFVTIDKRGSLMAVNNFVSRIMAAIVLISSKIFIDKLGLYNFFIIVFLIFIIFSTYFIINILKLKE